MTVQNFDFQGQWEALQRFLQKQKTVAPLALAFSGGLDSRFVAHAAQRAGCQVYLYHATGAHVPSEESHYAQQWAMRHNLPLQLFTVDVCSLEHVRDNSDMRCYYCKKHLLKLFCTAAQSKGLILCDGTNADDLQAHRPGLKALQEQDVLSPLAMNGLNKAMVRALAAHTGLEWPAQKASPCLLTRLHYGMQVQPQLLQRIAQAEVDLHRAGVQECRIRMRPEPLLQMRPHDVPEAEIRRILQRHGFEAVQLLQEQSISGFFDRKS